MAVYGMVNHNGANISLLERNRQQQFLDKSRAEPATYDQSVRQQGHPDRNRELSKKLEY